MNWDYSRQYARFHPDTPEHDRNLRDIFRHWLGPFLPARKEAVILDVGCGRGYAIAWLRDLGYTNVSGIDPDAGQVAFARQRGLPVEQAADSASYLRARPQSCDLILSMDVLEHVPRRAHREFLESMHAALRPGAALLCTTINADSPLASHWRHVDYTHEATFTAESLEFLFSHAGLRVTRVSPLEFWPAPTLLFWPPSRRTLRWWLLQVSRLQPRLACIGEFGWREGRRVALSPNLLALAVRD